MIGMKNVAMALLAQKQRICVAVETVALVHRFKCAACKEFDCTLDESAAKKQGIRHDKDASLFIGFCVGCLNRPENAEKKITNPVNSLAFLASWARGEITMKGQKATQRTYRKRGSIARRFSQS